MAELLLYSQTEFDYRIAEGLPVGCPTLDLCASRETSGKHVYIHRPPQQIVSKISELSSPGIQAPEALTLAWKADGKSRVVPEAPYLSLKNIQQVNFSLWAGATVLFG
jgi:hypothetical protein